MKLFPKLPELNLPDLAAVCLVCVPFFIPLVSTESMSIFHVVFLGGVWFFVVLYCIKYLRAKNRTEAMRALAGRLEMEFEAEKFNPIILGIDNTASHIGQSEKAFNLIKGTFEDTDAFIFDYHYVSNTPSMISWGTNTSQTVIAFKICSKDGFKLPQFTCKPERFYHRFTNIFGSKGIYFEQYPEFSKAYRLIGKDAGSIRKIFNVTVIRQLEAVIKQRWHVDAAGEWLIIHRYNKIIKPNDCPRFLSDCTTLLSAMTLT